MNIIFYPIITSFFWGLSSIFDKLSMSGDFPPLMIFIISGMVYSLITIVLLIANKNKLIPYFNVIKYKMGWIYAILSGISVFAIANLLYLYALNKSNHGYVIVTLAYSAPIFTVLLGIIVLKHDYSWKSLMGVLLVILGVLLVCMHNKEV